MPILAPRLMACAEVCRVVQSCARAGGAPDGHFERTKPISCLFALAFKNDKAKFPVPSEPWGTLGGGGSEVGETGAEEANGEGEALVDGPRPFLGAALG